jgi:hypothetical protein
VNLRVAGILIAAGMMLFGAFEPFFLKIYFHDRAAMGAYFSELPYRRAEGLRELLLEAEARIPTGSTVVFAAPFTEYDGGYRYTFGRANYLLAGRRLIATVPRPAHSQRDIQPEYLVGWRVAVPSEVTIEYQSRNGFVARIK